MCKIYIIVIAILVSECVNAHVIFDFKDDMQGWSRYNDSMILSHEDNCLVVRYQEPGGEWYPIIQRPSLSYDAAGHEEISLKVTAYKIPAEGMLCRFLYWNSDGYGVGYFNIYPGQSIVRFNASEVYNSGQYYEGTINKIRFDMPKAPTLSYSDLSEAEIRIDWIAATNNDEFVAADEKGQFIVVNFSTTGPVVNQALFDDLKTKLPNHPQAKIKAGASRMIRLMENPDATNALTGLRIFLELAELNNVPIVVQIDIENWWTNRQDLWNWWDSSMSGYNPNNRNNVEWYGWGSQNAIKISWRNWGSLLRVKPAPNLMSPQYRAEVHRLYELALPVIVQWWNNLPAGKKDLFIGLKVGWESSIGLNSFYYPNGNYYYENWPTDSSHDPTYSVNGTLPPAYGVQQIGYAALTSAGIKTSGSITESDLARVTGMHLTDLAMKANELGIPRDKIFTHSWHFKNSGTNMLAAVNNYSNPGWSYYTNNNSGIRNLDADINNAINNSNASCWAVSETLFQGSDTTSAWQTFFENNLDTRCKFINLFNWDNITESQVRLNAIRNLQNEYTESFSLQNAVDSTAEGGTITVPRGYYYENIQWQGKSLTIVSEDQNDWDVVFDTVIDAGSLGSAFDIQNAGKTVTIKGITIKNGQGINGGAINCIGGNLNIENCRIYDCTTRDFGGGLYLQGAEVNIKNCLLFDNVSVYGGAVYASNSDVNIINSTFTGNHTTNKGTAIRANSGTNIKLHNSILCNNQPEFLCQAGIRDSAAVINFCNIQNGQSSILLEGAGNLMWGPGNVDKDAGFVDAEKDDYHLRSISGRSVTFGTGLLADDSTSQMIDAGCPGDIPADEPLSVDNKRIDMGSYGGTNAASVTPAGFGLLSDIDNDGLVNFSDYALLTQFWLSSDEDSICVDLTRDGQIDIEDIAETVQEWLAVSGAN
ncbi:MAG: dockerin type I domain-containing protein [Phycisphaerae bacterium]|jgi:hypothetical protein